jgi:hypothetical protein
LARNPIPDDKKREYKARYKERHPDRVRASWHRQHLKKFGLTPEDFARMLDEQNNVCWICEKPEKDRRLAVDHCHETGVIRGLLCSQCNTGIGKLYHSPQLLARAINYLSRFDSGE